MVDDLLGGTIGDLLGTAESIGEDLVSSPEIALPFSGFPVAGESLITPESELGQQILAGDAPAEDQVLERLSAGETAMVHRDPETGQFRAGDGGEQLSYADFEVQNFVKDIQGTLGGATASTAQRDDFEAAGPGGLDHNEVAELVTMYRHHAVEIKSTGGTGADATSPGSWNSSYSLGVNMEDEEDITSDDIIRSAGVTFHQTDRANQLDASYLAGHVPYQDVASSSGGGGSGANHAARFVNFRHNYGRGPVIDSNDDLTIRMDVEKTAAGADTVVEGRTYGQLTWLIHEVPTARRQLGF